ncbi:MAG TPA: glycosyltransferase family 2 protein [Armatimonadaceae bacterium]|jgi:GT2 family glycosyltransferase|nr:glycosyltransferase family 2 protein [Armatimonadaceae bacterium]
MVHVAVIILNYNGYSDTIECLYSVKAQIGVVVSPLVVDNASSDDSVKNIREAHPDVEILVTGHNLGYAGGNNVGIQHVLRQGCDYVFIINNDTTLEPDCVRGLVHTCEVMPRAGIVTPAIYFYDNPEKPWFTGGVLDLDAGIVGHIQTDWRQQKEAEAVPTSWANGCAMLLPAAVLESLGGFDERFFCYWEDTDLSLRAREAGYECYISTQAVLYHKVGMTISRKSHMLDYYMTRNHLLFVSKHRQGAERRRGLWMPVRQSFQRWKHLLRHCPGEFNPHYEKAVMVGILDYHLRRFGPCRRAGF